MNKGQRQIARKLCILRHSEKTGHLIKTCRYIGVGRGHFHRWREACRKRNDAQLVRQPWAPLTPASITALAGLP